MQANKLGGVITAHERVSRLPFPDVYGTILYTNDTLLTAVQLGMMKVNECCMMGRVQNNIVEDKQYLDVMNLHIVCLYAIPPDDAKTWRLSLYCYSVF